MVARINTVAFQGVKDMEVDVQVQIASSVPAFTVVGLLTGWPLASSPTDRAARAAPQKCCAGSGPPGR